MDRERFVAELKAHSAGATLRLDTPEGSWPVFAILTRHRGCLHFSGPNGLGLSFHRNGGISICGIPSSGGTTIAWGKCRERIGNLGRDHRVVNLGPVAIFIGSDF